MPRRLATHLRWRWDAHPAGRWWRMRALLAPRRRLLRDLLAPTGRPARYRLRGGGGEVLLRSGGRDVDVFEEIFLRGEYDPPAEVLAALGEQPSIADLGGNVGLFAVRMFERFPGCSVVSFEPDPDNLPLLRAAREASPHAGRWRLVEAAAGSRPGTLAFLSGQQANSRAVAAGSDGAIEVPVVDVFADLDGCDLLKIDIEGGEWELLADPRLGASGVRAVALEFHGYGQPPGDMRELATGALQRAGFTVRHVAWDPVGVGRLWAWR